MIKMYQPRYITGVIVKYEEVENVYNIIIGGRFSAGGLQFRQTGRRTERDDRAATAAAAPEKVSWFSDVSFWNPPSPWNTDPKTVEGAITQKTGLTFDFNIPAQDGGTKLSLMLATSEELPDLITVTDDKLVKKLIRFR